MKRVSTLAALAMCLTAATSQAFDLFDETATSAQTEPPAHKSQDVRPLIDVAPDGTNLRRVLADSGVAAEVIPLTSRLTFVVLDMAGKRIMPFYEANVRPLCKRGWMIQTRQIDPMTDRESMVWQPAGQDFYRSVLHSGRQGKRSVMVKCSDAFEALLERDMHQASGMQNTPFSLGSTMLIEHTKDQPFIWKSNRIGNPDGMPLPQDGLLDRSRFALQDPAVVKAMRSLDDFTRAFTLKPKPVTNQGLDDAADLVRVLGWLSRKCSEAGGDIRLYRDGGRGTERIDFDLGFSINTAHKHYISCSSPEKPLFVLRTDNLAFRRGASYETLWK